MKKLVLLAMLVIACLTTVLPGCYAQAARELWVIPWDQGRPDEMMLAQSLQGLSGRVSPMLMLDCGAMSAVVLKQLQEEGVQIHRLGSVWDLPDNFWKIPSGFILYRLNDKSLNVATSLAGPINAVAATDAIVPRLKSKGLQQIYNAVGVSESQILQAYRAKFSNSIAVEQILTAPSHLRDFAILNNAFVFSAGADYKLRKWVAQMLTPGTSFFGWGPDEYHWIQSLSQVDSEGVGSDWCVNLSALSKLPVRLPVPRQAPNPAPVRPGERIVAFLLSDGDNLQWLTGSMPLDPKWFANPHRGEFVMNWGVSPLLASLAPRVLKYFYEKGTDKDFFFAMGSPGYRYIHAEPGVKGEIDARQTRPYLQASHLQTVAVINQNEGGLDETIPLLELPEVDGVVYLPFSPYHRLGGKMLWHHGKPAVSCKFSLWENLPGGVGSIQAVANQITRMPALPNNPDSYAIVIVHAWSFDKMGGPVEAVRETIKRLPSNCRVVSIKDFFTLLKENCSH